MSEENWLYNKDGEVHRGLHTCTSAEVERLAKENAADPMNKEIDFGLGMKPGDYIRLDPKYMLARHLDGWTVLRHTSKSEITGDLSLLVECTDGTCGGWVRPDMVIAWKRSPVTIEKTLNR